jgi:hypothetical protein
LLLAGVGAAGNGQPTAAPVAAETGPDTRIVVGYFLKTATIEFVDGTKRRAVEVLTVRDDGNLRDLNGQAWILADNAIVFPEGSATERLSWSELKPGTRLHLYCTAHKDGAYGPPVLKVGVPAAARSSARGGSPTQTPSGPR